jgi:hypothetical protein
MQDNILKNNFMCASLSDKKKKNQSFWAQRYNRTQHKMLGSSKYLGTVGIPETDIFFTRPCITELKWTLN